MSGSSGEPRPNRHGQYLAFCGDCVSVDDIDEGLCLSCESSEEVSFWVPIEQCDGMKVELTRLRTAMREAMTVTSANYPGYKILEDALKEGE